MVKEILTEGIKIKFIDMSRHAPPSNEGVFITTVYYN